MSIATLLIDTSAIALVGAGYFIGVPILLKPWAKRDEFWTIAKEAKGKVAVTGGSFNHAILTYDGYHLNDPRKKWFDADFPEWEVLVDQPDERYDDRWSVIRAFGGYWVGLPWLRKIYWYDFMWNEMSKDKEGKPCIKKRDEETPYWYAMDFEYVIVIDDAKTVEGLPVRLEYVVTVRITNPRKALFETDNWLLRVEAAANRVAKNFAASYKYEELRGEGENDANETAKHNFSLPIIRLSEQLLDEPDGAVEDYVTGTKGRYGITIKAADLQSVVLIGEAAKTHEEMSLEGYSADQKNLVKRKNADGDVYVTVTTRTAGAEMTEREGTARANADESRLGVYAKNPGLASVMLNADAQSVDGARRTVIFADPIARLADKAGLALGLLGKPSAPPEAPNEGPTP